MSFRFSSLLLLGLIGCSFVENPVFPTQTFLIGQTHPASPAISFIAGVTLATIEHANGNCFDTCRRGTACNAATRRCEPIPCDGKCTPSQVCDTITNVCEAALSEESENALMANWPTDRPSAP